MADYVVPQLTPQEFAALRALVRIYIDRRITGPGVTFSPEGITINPPPPPVDRRASPPVALLKAYSGVAGATHRYNGRIIPVNAKSNPPTSLSVVDLGTPGQQDDCEIWNLAEFESDPLVLGLRVGFTDAGKPIYLAANRGTQEFRYNASNANLQTSYRLIRQADTDWKNAVQFDTCSTTEGGPVTGARMFGNAAEQEAGGARGTIFGESLVTINAPNTITTQISTANTATDGTGTLGTLNTFGSSGGSLYRVRAKALGATRNGLIRIFHQPGGGSGPKRWIASIQVPETNPKSGEDTWFDSWIAEDQLNGFPMKSGDKIYCSTHEADTFNVTGIGGDV